MRILGRRLLMGGVGVLFLAYLAAVGYTGLNETRMVFSGAQIEDPQDWLPAEDGGVPWDTVRILGEDDVPVLLLESRLGDAEVKPWAMFFHGNGGLLGAPGSVKRYDLLREAGFNVLALEFRGYGVSRGVGPPFESGLYADAMSGLNYLTEFLGVDPTQVVAYGWSLGAGVATHLAAKSHIGGLVTEGAFTSAPDMGAARYPWLPVRLFMRNRFDNLERAEDLLLPWLIFHGRADTVVPFSHAEMLAAASAGARLAPLNAGHSDGVLASREVALDELRALVQRVTAPGFVGG